MLTIQNGLLIALEGIDGCGKSTLARTLAEHLSKQYATTVTKEPGATALGVQLRTILQEQSTPICPTAEFLLFAADRAHHFDTVVLPALAQHKIVVSDRMADSSVVYQGYARGLSIPMIESINSWCMQQRKPDLTFYLRISAPEAMERILKRQEKLTRFEKEGLSFVQKLVDGFDDLFNHKKHGIFIDASSSAQTVLAETIQHIDSWIKSLPHS